MKQRIVIIVQCRIRSKRLPSKALLNITSKENMFQFLLKRLKLVKNANKIIVTTGNSKINNPIKKFAERENIEVFRGDENNVLKRFYDASIKTNADIIVRITADNPLSDPFLIDNCISFFKKKKIEHLSCFDKNLLPYGVGCGIFTKEVLKYTYLNVKSKLDKEHVESFMLRSKKISTFHYNEKKINNKKIRLSVDYKNDYDYVHGIANYLFKKYRYKFSTKHITKLVENPRILIFANGQLGVEGLKFFLKKKYNIVGIITHPISLAKNHDQIIKLSKLKKNRIISYDELDNKENWLSSINPTICFSFWSSYIIPQALLKKIPLGVYNLHNSLLPSYKGSGANIWPIIDNQTFSGVSLHRVTERVDSGPIIAQKKILINKTETGLTLFKKQQKEMMNLLKKKINNIFLNYQINYIKNNLKKSFVSKNKRDLYKEIKLNEKYRAKNLFQIINAYDFGDFDSAFFTDNHGQKWNIKISLRKRK